MHRIDEQSTIEITNSAYYIIFHYTNIAHKSHFLIPTMWQTNYRLNPKLPMPNFLKHSTAYPAVNIPVGRRYRNTQSLCNLQVDLAGKGCIFRQGDEEHLLSGRREGARWVIFYFRQGAEDFTGVFH